MEEQKTPKISVWDLPDVPKGKLPPHLELQRTRVLCTSDAPTHTENIRYSGAYASMGVDNSLQLKHFHDNFRVEVIRLNEDDMEFDMIGIDAALANALRRILIAEVC
ncbi:DNA-directed RNA polymerases I and III subunit rpac1 [Olea europaea subsp. europaea]|uniref:DNA-directed RNA polymerases I and III subunit rpac1 n=1 Tax=Olea europaea subsp. europaea TaxID=158383 RepID=A0A8S0UD16_OLEEU|nr:DNA-directed RNA polymerases I and III subunit rpac1 [Olea europaea subsp. europaea]